MNYKIQKWDAVRIEWSDPAALPGEWQKISQDDTKIVGCVTVGQVYRIHEDRITVLCSWDSHNKHANGGVTIPFVLIHKLSHLIEEREDEDCP